MNKSDIRILIVEDDLAVGQSLTEFLKRSGYETVLCLHADQALTLTEHQDFQALIIDCMLPRMNGVDLAQAILAKADPKPPLFLMTGVFKDKTFMREAIAKTGALEFFYKPFPPEKLFEAVDKELKKLYIDPDLDPLSTLLTHADCSSSQIVEALQAQSSFHAYHLPLIFALFTRQGMTGELSITNSERETSTVTYLEGKIVDVRSPATTTQMGQLLVEFGFAMLDDVEEALAHTSPKLPLGIRLVQAGALSPHAVGLIREEQLAIRLSQMIQNTSIEVSWAKKDIEMKDTFHSLPPSRLKQLMSEWILSKLPVEWLRSLYLPLSERTLNWRGKAAMKLEGAKANMPLLPIIIERVTSQPILQDLLNEVGEAELPCLQAVHALVLERKVYFGEKRRSVDEYSAKVTRYERLLKSYKAKDFFQILGVSRKARLSEVHRAYTDLAKRFHPDTISPDAPSELKKVCADIFALITNAHDTLSEEMKRNAYLDDLDRKEANRVFELEPIYEAALASLQAQKYSKAEKKFDELLAVKAPMPDLKAYAYWAKLKAGTQKITERDFFEIPPENRHSPIYLFAKGLYFKANGQYQKALECFQNARFLDPKLTEAQREIAELLDEAGTKVTGMNTILSKLLGKTKKSA